MTTNAADALPTHVQIGPFTYSLEVSAERARDADITYGWTDVAHAALVFNPDQHDMQMRDTVLHEVLHAILDQLAVSKGLLDHEEEERLVHPLSTVLLDTLRRNPQLVAYLTR